MGSRVSDSSNEGRNQFVRNAFGKPIAGLQNVVASKGPGGLMRTYEGAVIDLRTAQAKLQLIEGWDTKAKKARRAAEGEVTAIKQKLDGLEAKMKAEGVLPKDFAEYKRSQKL